MKNKIKNRFIFIAVISSLIVLQVLSFFSMSSQLEHILSDMKFRNFNLNTNPTDEVVVITIDDSSLKYFQNFGFSYPWPRLVYSKVLDFLVENKAKAVFFDILFNEKDLERSELSSEESDQHFANSLSSHEKIYLASQLTNDERFSLSHASAFLKIENKESSKSFAGIVKPLPQFLQHSKSGFINVFPDNDGVIRKLDFNAKIKDKSISSLPFHLLKDLNYDINLYKNKDAYFVNWYPKSSFKVIPIKAVMQTALAYEQDHEPTIDASFFKEKIVLIGASASGLMDQRTVPIEKNYPGVLIWATVISNFVNGDFYYHSNSFIDFILIFVVSFLTAFISIHLYEKKTYVKLTYIIAIIFFMDILFWYLFHIQIHTIFALFVFTLIFLSSQIMLYFTENRERKNLKKTFSRYMNEQLVDYIVQESEQISMGGKESEVSIIFTDIYDFTTISENCSPQEIVQTLNLYFNDLTQFILNNNGLLDKFTGDGIMAVFGPPLADKLHALNACSSLIQYKKFCENLKLKETLTKVDKIHLKTRLAVNSGRAITGNIGSEKRMDFTAIGDTVNLAARLEAVNKLYGTQFLISDETYQLVKNTVFVRKLDTITVKGKDKPTVIYELLGFDEAAKKEYHILYEEALHFYEKKNWTKAQQILQNYPSDIPSQKLLDRIKRLIIENPEKWDPIRRLVTK